MNILLDPVWSKRVSPVTFAGPRRVNDPGISFDVLPPINAVLVSHCHYDHMDMPTLSAVAARHRPRFIVPLGNDTIIRSYDAAAHVDAYDWYVDVPLSRDVKVVLVPTRHWSSRGAFDRNKALWASFVIETPAGRILFVGDSGYGDGFHFRNVRTLYGPIRLAILPIGAYEPSWFMRDMHMDPEEAVRAFIDTGAERASRIISVRSRSPTKRSMNHLRDLQQRCSNPVCQATRSSRCGPVRCWSCDGRGRGLSAAAARS